MANGLVRARIERGVAVMHMTHPPLNTLDVRMRAALSEAIAYFVQDERAKAIVLGTDSPTFSAGIDVQSLTGSAPDMPLRTLCAQFEECPKPIVVALNGAVLSGGAELALSAHARVADETTTLGFPDVGLGLTPSGGASQRLSRLVGPKVALQLLLSGKPLNEMVGQRLGLFDKVVKEDAVGAAITVARALIADGKPPQRTCDVARHVRKSESFINDVALARRRPGNSYAKARIIDCVEAAVLMSFEAAVDFEATAYEACMTTPESRALRHVFVAETRISTDLLAPLQRGARKVTKQGQEVLERLFEAQDSAVIALIEGGATEAEIDGAMVAFGLEAGPFGGSEAVENARSGTLRRRILSAVMAEGARCVEDGAVARPSDIDALAVHGMKWPRLTGGPMQAAMALGLLGIVRQMEEWAREDPVWAVPPNVSSAAMLAEGFWSDQISPA